MIELRFDDTRASIELSHTDDHVHHVEFAQVRPGQWTRTRWRDQHPVGRTTTGLTTTQAKAAYGAYLAAGWRPAMEGVSA